MRTEESSNFLKFLCVPCGSFYSSLKYNQEKVQEICSPSCGNIKNISYPFRVKGDPARCGSPYFELSCQSNKTILEINSGKYYVKRISYE
ncbi:hypothetical protein Patl1_15136 [Pistacia atlantica]|uniref:Uncharacterized protein n=1 Tax=Pistacia atlantica TaxID=434234 RepID=A0ACC1BB63_9ROSI|nr:hypothetical protein Patl1_15136 [Pistacia atlantica]